MGKKEITYVLTKPVEGATLKDTIRHLYLWVSETGSGDTLSVRKATKFSQSQVDQGEVEKYIKLGYRAMNQVTAIARKQWLTYR